MGWVPVLIAAGSLFIWMHWVEPNRFQISRCRVKLRKSFPKSLRILHLSDIHFARPHQGLSGFFDRLAFEAVDLVVISGDIIDVSEGISYAVQQLSKLKPAMGMYAVLGNHDYYDYTLWDVLKGSSIRSGHPEKVQDVERLIREFRQAGIRVLQNESSAFEWQGQTVRIHGLDDPTTDRAEPDQITPQLKQEGVHILLTHSVDALMLFADQSFDVSFSGHSHGGQIRLPWIGALVSHTRLGKRYAQGIHEKNGTLCVISRGLNASRSFRYRLLCLPEAVLVEAGA